MKQTLRNSPFQMARLGRCDADDQVRQAVASVTLEGMKPSKHSVQLAHFVAIGQMSTEQAVAELRNYYGRKT